MLYKQNGTKLVPSARVKPVEFADMRYTLTITGMTQDEEGSYEVVGINAAGEARCEAQVTIQEAVVAPSKAPSAAQEAKFVKPFVKESKAIEGQPTNLQVQVQSGGGECIIKCLLKRKQLIN